jgi:tight adherence protein C
MKLLTVLTTLILALVPLASAHAQSAPLDVQEVRTDAFPRIVVRLRESPDAVQATLDPNHLTVLENGQEQPSADVRQLRSPTTPTSIALAIDTSGSMAEQDKFAAAQVAAKAFASQIRPIDKVAVISFSDEVNVPQFLTADRQLVNRSIDQLTPGGNTSLYDAVAQGLTQLSLSPAGSRALVVLTDGNDTASERQALDDIAQAVQMAVPIYAIGLGDDADAKILEQFAKETGGQYYHAPAARDLSNVFRLISRQLSAEYQVSWISTTNHTSTADVPIEINIAHTDGTQTSASLAYAPPAFAIRSTQQAPAFQALREIAPALAPTEQQVMLAGALAGLGVFVLTFGIIRRRGGKRLHARLSAVISGNQTEADKFALRRTHLSPVTAAAANVTGRLLPSRLITYLRYRMVQAGYQQDRQVGVFLALELLLAILVGALVYLFIQSRGFFNNSPAAVLALTAFAILVGGYLPYMWLRRRVDSRQKSLMRALPDALDLMVISVTAGLSLDTAMSEVVRKWDGDLSREFNQILNEMRMGVSRRDALRNFADRTRLQDIQLLVAALLQADEMGSDISEVLSAQADQLRIRRHHYSEERARKAPVKMLLPMVGLIFPAMFAILLAPGFLQLTSALNNLKHG